jgi:hypothetical protein
MNRTKFARLQTLICGILPLIAIAALPAAAPGKEPGPKCATFVAEETAIPVLSDIPYFGQFFKSVKHTPVQDFERIGVDFEFEICPDCPVPLNISSAACTQSAQAQRFAARRASHQQTAAPCCEEACCENAHCCKNEACCGEDCAEGSSCCRASCETAEHRGLSWERIVKLTAKNAALEASLDALSEFHEEKSEMMESLAEMAIEKARLEVQVETLTQQSQATKEMLALISENARLKAQAQLAETKLTVVHEMAKLAMENEQLKLALQKRHTPGQLADDVQYFPPGPEFKPSRTAPAKKASFHEVQPAERPSDPLER